MPRSGWLRRGLTGLSKLSFSGRSQCGGLAVRRDRHPPHSGSGSPGLKTTQRPMKGSQGPAAEGRAGFRALSADATP